MGVMANRTSYIRPDVVYRTGNVRPFSYGADPVAEAYAIAIDFTRDPAIVQGQYGVKAANTPNVEIVQPDFPTSVPVRGAWVPGFIRRFFGGR